MKASSTTVTTGPLRNIGQQCGGKGYKGGTVCEPDLICLYQGEWSSTCLCPDKSWRCRNPTTTTKVTTPSAVVTSQTTKTSQGNLIHSFLGISLSFLCSCNQTCA